MTNITKQAYEIIAKSQHLLFLTGAGVSVPSGIPDYRSLNGIYHGIDQPEYLLSHTCLIKEPEKFYAFVKNLFHPEAQPNVIHEKMAQLEKIKPDCWIITQNIDELHDKAGSQNVIHFHGSLNDIFCSKCGKKVSVATYLESDTHQNCGGQLRSNVVLYEESLSQTNIQQAIQKIIEADTIVITGTSLKVYPFASLIGYKSPHCRVIVVNKDELETDSHTLNIIGDAEDFFKDLPIS